MGDRSAGHCGRHGIYRCVTCERNHTNSYHDNLNDLDARIALQSAEIKRLREVIPALKRALHDISLCSQNSMTSKRECGGIARAALDATSELLGGGDERLR